MDGFLILSKFAPKSCRYMIVLPGAYDRAGAFSGSALL